MRKAVRTHARVGPGDAHPDDVGLVAGERKERHPDERCGFEPYQRPDLPTVGAATRGSITGATAAAHPEAREEALRNLHRDQYANNTRNTGIHGGKLAQQWGLPPLPITIDLVNAIRAGLKQGAWPVNNTSPWSSSPCRWTSSCSSSRRSGASNVASGHRPSRTPSPWKTWHQ